MKICGFGQELKISFCMINWCSVMIMTMNLCGAGALIVELVNILWSEQSMMLRVSLLVGSQIGVTHLFLH